GPLDEAIYAVLADAFERGLLGGKIVVERGLPHAEHVGDGLRRGAVIAAFGKHAGRGIDDRFGAAKDTAVAHCARASPIGLHSHAPGSSGAETPGGGSQATS